MSFAPPEPFEPNSKLQRWLDWLRLGRVVGFLGGEISEQDDGVLLSVTQLFDAPFKVFYAKDGESDGFKVASGYLIDRLQSQDVEITNLGDFVSLATSGYIWLKVNITDNEATDAEIEAGAAGWTDFPTPFEFDSDPFAYDGSGTPPAQTAFYLTLAKYIADDPKPLRQLVTTHLQMRLVTYAGLPALQAFAGYGPNDPA